MISCKEIKTVRQGDPNFQLTDGIGVYPRAMLHVLPECPANIREYIQWAYENGYIKCVAHVPGKQLTWEKLIDD
jgi:hypothetical protein